MLRIALASCAIIPTTRLAPSLDRARQLFDSAGYSEAKAELLALDKANGQNAAVAFYLGQLALIANEGDEAVRQCERAVHLEELNALYHTARSNHSNSWYIRLGHLKVTT